MVNLRNTSEDVCIINEGLAAASDNTSDAIGPTPQLKETRFEWLSLLHHRKSFGSGRSY